MKGKRNTKSWKRMPPVVDEEELVREVLEDNPAEDRGVRDEWAAHIGWHRKEDVRGPTHIRGATEIQSKTQVRLSTLTKSEKWILALCLCLLASIALLSRRTRGRSPGKPRSL